MSPTWLTAFLDLPEGEVDQAVSFWCAVTGSSLSAPRGDRSEFATFQPADGDGYLKVQRLGEGASRLHLDLHAPGERFRVETSPGGLPWCRVSHPAGRRPRPVRWPGGHQSLVDQVCLDIPADLYDDECAFWARVTGWTLKPGGLPEFRYLERPPDIPLRLLLQRLDQPGGEVRAHLDLATDDRPAEVRRHQGLGSRIEAVRSHWTVMRDPVGSAYCITDRDPVTGRIGRQPA